MTREQRPATSLFTQVDISANAQPEPPSQPTSSGGQVTQILEQILVAQDRQNELLEEMMSQMNSAQRQRATELNQWKQANPHLADTCRQAAETLSQVQSEFLHSLTTEVEENGEGMMDGEFMLTEFVDRFGPRLAHLNGVLQVLSQLSSSPTASDTTDAS